MSDVPTFEATTGSPLRNAAVLSGRSTRLSRRNVDVLVTSVMLPVMILLVFVYLFGGAIRSDGTYKSYVIPGVLLLCAGFGAATTAVTVTQDMTGGIVDRLRARNVSGAAVLAGHVVGSVVRNVAATACVIGVAFAIGFRPTAGVAGWLAAVGVLLLFVVAISWVAACVGLVAKTAEAASAFSFVLMFLPYASSAFVPVETMPSWLQGFARNQPITSVVETIRGQLLGTPTGNAPLLAVLWCAGLLAVSMLTAGVLFRRRTG